MITKDEFLTQIQIEDWKRNEGRKKTSFWASDCLRPSCDIYWRWMDEPETNPIKPSSLLLMQVGKLFEQRIVEFLRGMGEIKDAEKTDLPVKDGQFRVEMEREYVPVTGYMDAVHAEGFPIEIKTHYAQTVDRMLENGQPPSDHYCHQLAVYMDFMGVDKGLMISANRANGNIFFSDMERLGDLRFRCKGYEFDLGKEYARFRRIMENNIHEHKEPELEYLYRPDVTAALLDQYKEDKIKKAIKGERVLCDHKWRYQYSSWKEKVIEKEASMRGVSVADLCTYTKEDTEFMMNYLNVEWRFDKNGKAKLFKIKVTK